MTDNTNDKTLEDLQAAVESNSALRENLIEAVKTEHEAAEQYQKKLSSMHNQITRTLAGQDFLVKKIMANPVVREQVSPELELLLSRITSQQNLLDSIVTDKDYIPHVDRHLGGLVGSINKLIEMCQDNVRTMSLETGLELSLDIQVDDVDCSLYSSHDFIFVTEMFRYMSLFFKDIADETYRMPEMTYEITPTDHPDFYFSNLYFTIWNPNVLPENFQKIYDEFYYTEEQITNSWEGVNGNLKKLLVICSRYSVKVKFEQDTFGRTIISIGRKIYVCKQKEFFDSMKRLRQQYKAARVYYVGKDKENEEINCTLRLINSSLYKHTYIEFGAFNHALLTALLSHTRLIFVSKYLTPKEICELSHYVFNCPFDKVRIVACNRKDKCPIEHDRLIWTESEINTFEFAQLIS